MQKKERFRYWLFTTAGFGLAPLILQMPLILIVPGFSLPEGAALPEIVLPGFVMVTGAFSEVATPPVHPISVVILALGMLLMSGFYTAVEVARALGQGSHPTVHSTFALISTAVASASMSILAARIVYQRNR